MLGRTWIAGGLLTVSALCFSSVASAQDGGRDWDRGHDAVRRLDPGTVIPVRNTRSIDVDKGNDRVYDGTVDRDVRGDNGRLVIPQGAHVEMMVRYTRDNDLILDLESVEVHGQRYAIRTDPKHIESERDNSLVGSIVGAINGGEARGRAVRIPRDSVVTFRLDRPLVIGVADEGTRRDGQHYHDWYHYDRDHNGYNH